MDDTQITIQELLDKTKKYLKDLVQLEENGYTPSKQRLEEIKKFLEAIGS